MDQINHIGRPCDSELRFCGTAQRFFLDTTALGRTSWAGLADARQCSSLPSSGLGRADGRGKDGGEETPISPELPSAQRRSVGGIVVGRDHSGRQRTVWVQGCACVVRVRVGLHSAGQGRLGLARPGSEAGAMRRGVGWWFLGMQTQWRSQTVVQDGGMSEVYLATFLTECVCEWLCVCVCVPRGSASPAFGGLHRWVRTHHAETLERWTWRKIRPTLPKEGREASPLSQLTMRQFCLNHQHSLHLFFLKGIIFGKMRVRLCVYASFIRSNLLPLCVMVKDSKSSCFNYIFLQSKGNISKISWKQLRCFGWIIIFFLDYF